MNAKSQGSQSFSISHEEIDQYKLNDRLASLNYPYFKVRRPDEDNILQFIHDDPAFQQISDLQTPEKQVSDFEQEIIRKNDQELRANGTRKTIVEETNQPFVMLQPVNSHEVILINDSPYKFPESDEKDILIDYVKADQLVQSIRMSPLRKRKESPMIQTATGTRRISIRTTVVSRAKGIQNQVRKFVRIIKSINPFKRQPNFTQVQLISDLASYSEPQYEIVYKPSSKIKSNFKRKVTKKRRISLLGTDIAQDIQKMRFNCLEWLQRHEDTIYQILNHTIRPETWFYYIWISIKTILLYLLIFQFSITVVYNTVVYQWFFLERLSIANRPIWIFITIFFMADIYVSLKRVIYRDGIPVEKANVIARNYVHTYLISDVLSLVPMIANINFCMSDDNSVTLKLLNSFLMLKIPQFKDINKFYQMAVGLNSNAQALYTILSILKFNFIFTHVLSLIWFIEGQYFGFKHSWLDEVNYEYWYDYYTCTFFWIFQSSLNLGQIEMSPKNTFEYYLCIATYTTTFLIFIFSFSQIGNILLGATQIERQITNNISVLNSYMNRKKLDKQLQFKIRQYLHNLWIDDSKTRNEDENLLLNNLSTGLQEEIQISLYAKLIFSIPVLFRYFSQQFLMNLTKIIKEQKIAPKTSIIEMGSFDDQGLYFLIDGEADVLIELTQKKHIISVLKKGDIFGQASFFYNQPHAYTVKSRNTCTYAYVHYSDFVYLLRKFPRDYQTYRMLIDRIDLRRQNDHIDLGIKCLGCKNSTHDIDMCPFLHLIVDQLTIIRKHCHSQSNDRFSIKRMQRRSVNARFNQRIFREAASFFQENNVSLLTSSDESELIKEGRDYNDTYKSLRSKNSSTHRSHQIRKRSRSLNSGQESQPSYLLQPSYKSNSYASQKEIEKTHAHETLSAIVAPAQNPYSLLSSSSFNLFGKERKFSRQQDSDKVSSNSNAIDRVNLIIQKSSSQSKSARENSQSSGSNQVGKQVLPQPQISTISQTNQNVSPQTATEDVSFSQKPYEDSVFVAQQRKRKSLIGKNDIKQVRVHTASINLQPIPSVSEMDQSKIQEDERSKPKSYNGSLKQVNFYKTASWHSDQIAQEKNLRQISQKYSELRKGGKKNSGKLSFQSKNSIIYEEEENKLRSHNRGSSRFTGETFKQFQSNQPELPVYDFYESFEVPCNMQSYFPSQNIEVVLNNYQKYRQDKNTDRPKKR